MFVVSYDHSRFFWEGGLESLPRCKPVPAAVKVNLCGYAKRELCHMCLCGCAFAVWCVSPLPGAPPNPLGRRAQVPIRLGAQRSAHPVAAQRSQGSGGPSDATLRRLRPPRMCSLTLIAAILVHFLLLHDGSWWLVDGPPVGLLFVSGPYVSPAAIPGFCALCKLSLTHGSSPFFPLSPE